MVTRMSDIPESIKMRIRSVALLSPRNGMNISEFLHQFRDISSFDLDPREYGFSNVLTMLRSMPDTVIVRGEQIYGVDSGTARITGDIARQNKTKKKGKPKVLTGGFRRISAGHFSHPAHHNHHFGSYRPMGYHTAAVLRPMAMPVAAAQPLFFTGNLPVVRPVRPFAFTPQFNGSTALRPKSNTIHSTAPRMSITVPGSVPSVRPPPSPFASKPVQRSASFRAAPSGGPGSIWGLQVQSTPPPASSPSVPPPAISSTWSMNKFNSTLRERNATVAAPQDPPVSGKAEFGSTLWEKNTTMAVTPVVVNQPSQMLKPQPPVIQPSQALNPQLLFNQPSQMLKPPPPSVQPSQMLKPQSLFNQPPQVVKPQSPAPPNPIFGSSTGNVDVFKSPPQTPAPPSSVASTSSAMQSFASWAKFAQSKQLQSAVSVVPTASMKAKSEHYLTIASLKATVETNVMGEIRDVIERYIIFENTGANMAEFRNQLSEIWYPSTVDSEEYWHPGNVLLARVSVNEVERGVLLDSYVEPSSMALPPDDDFSGERSTGSSDYTVARMCKIYLFDRGQVRIVSSENICMLRGDNLHLLQTPPKCLLIALHNVVLLDEPRCIPLEPMVSSLSLHIRGFRHMEGKCEISGIYADPILPHVYLATSMVIPDENVDLCHDMFPQYNLGVLKPMTGIIHADVNKANEFLWQCEAHFALEGHSLTVRLCDPLHWWPRIPSPECYGQPRESLVENESACGNVVMLMVQIATATLVRRVDAYVETVFGRGQTGEKTHIVPGRVHLMDCGTNWVRVRVLRGCGPGQDGVEEFEVVLLDFPKKRFQRVNQDSLVPYHVLPEEAAQCPPYLCRALPVLVPDEQSAQQYLDTLVRSQSLVANRVGLAYTLNAT